MDKILVVDDNEDVLRTLTEGLELYKSQFRMISAADGSEAIELLNENKISLVITDLMMPKIGGLELISYMTRNFPAVPCIVMTRLDKMRSKEIFARQGVLRCIEKPFKIRQIGAAIIEGLDLLDEGITRNGIAVISFLPLVELEESTCLIKIKCAGNDSGFFYFEKGILFDASFRKLAPEQAAVEMLTWEGVEITFLPLPVKKVEKRIFSDLGTLISKARQIIEKNGRLADLTVPAKENPVAEVFIGPTPKKTKNDIIIEEILEPELIEQEFFVEIKPGNKEMIEEKFSGLKSLKGFISICVFSPGGEIVAGQYDDSGPLEKIGDLLFDIVRKAQKCFKTFSFGQPVIIDMETAGGEHFLIRGHTEHNISYLVILICSDSAETGRFKEHLALLVPTLAENLKTR
ncbi:MAG: response regulator [Desulfobacterales bacterium]